MAKSIGHFFKELRLTSEHGYEHRPVELRITAAMLRDMTQTLLSAPRKPAGFREYTALMLQRAFHMSRRGVDADADAALAGMLEAGWWSADVHVGWLAIPAGVTAETALAAAATLGRQDEAARRADAAARGIPYPGPFPVSKHAV